MPEYTGNLRQYYESKIFFRHGRRSFSNSNHRLWRRKRGASSADLSGLTVQPANAYSGYISRGTTFVLSWASASAAPRSTQVNLVRYFEARGDEDRGEFRERIDVNQSGASSWNVRHRSGDLAFGAVYYLDVRTALDRRRYAFTTSGGRAASPTRGVDISNGAGSGSLNNLTLRWTGEAAGSVGIATGTQFVLSFPSESQAPSRFTVRLRRFKEERGDESFSDSEQEISINHDPGSGDWVMRRRDNFRLESAATYVVEVDAPGEPFPRQYAFITEG
jgi:hypothetical protein